MPNETKEIHLSHKVATTNQAVSKGRTRGGILRISRVWDFRIR